MGSEKLGPDLLRTCVSTSQKLAAGPWEQALGPATSVPIRRHRIELIQVLRYGKCEAFVFFCVGQLFFSGWRVGSRNWVETAML